MTQKETIKLIGIITMAYPNFDKFKDENHIRSMVAVWADIFSEDNAGLVPAIPEHRPPPQRRGAGRNTYRDGARHQEKHRHQE